MAANSTVAFEQHVARVRGHALLASAAWLVVIPIGTLLPRYIRTFTTARWWLAHAFLNFVVSGPLLLASWMILKPELHPHSKMPPDIHKRVGLIIFGLYIAQCVLGLFIHYVRIPFPILGSRPPAELHSCDNRPGYHWSSSIPGLHWDLYKMAALN